MPGRTQRLTLFLLLLCLFAATSQASIIDFTGIGVSDVTEIPDGYAGFNWNLVYYLNAGLQPPESGYGKLVTSEGAPDLAMIPEFSTGSFSRATPFTLDSINLAAGWNDNVNVQISGWLRGVRLYSSNLTLGVSSAPASFQPGWGGQVNAVTIAATSHGTEMLLVYSWAAHVGIGDIAYTDSHTPEPGTLLGMAAGLALILVKARRRIGAA